MFADQPATASTWARRLHAVAARGPLGPRISDPALPGEPAFADELGHRRRIDDFLVAALTGVMPPPPPPPPAGHPAESADLALWRLAAGRAGEPEPFLRREPVGPLLWHAPGTTIEVLTEAELAALHALWTIARLNQREDLVFRCFAAAEWHLDELQPDNATHLPWAIHVFVMLALTRGRADAGLDAETRLHNALTGAGGGRPDARSAMILEHAARELDLVVDRSGSAR
jgi:hypothetical protein